MNQNSDPSARLAPIPVPPARWWREIRTRVLPLIGFAAALATACLIWRERVAAPMLRGRVEAVQAQVASPQPGILTELTAARFVRVSRGQPVAVIAPTDPRVPLAMIQADLDVLRARLQPSLVQQRNSTDYERLRLAWLLQKVDLAMARVNLARAENELQRDEQLFRAKVISEQLYDFSLKARDALRAEVEERTKTIAELDQGLQQLKVLGDPQAAPPSADLILKSIKTQEERLQSAGVRAVPITLVSPIDGMVSTVYRQAGENVQLGDPILEISASQPDHIVGYLRQPFAVEPMVGMPVQVWVRFPKPAVHPAQILEIGPQVETITNALAIVRPGMLIDVGLPLKISLPPGLKVRPGELVDLILRPRN